MGSVVGLVAHFGALGKHGVNQAACEYGIIDTVLAQRTEMGAKSDD